MEKNMKENFKKLEERVFDCLNDSDLEKINFELSKINEPCLVSGVGGSSVVSCYASKILSKKNKIITKSVEPRDMVYIDKDGFKNVLACSYSGNNYGVDLAFNNELRHYLLASKESLNSDVCNITYNINDKEKSFISLAATLCPCAILLNYYNESEWYRIIDNLWPTIFNFDTTCDCYEIFTGYETITASKFLESTFVESGIGIPIVHDKYSYCHGRSTLSTCYSNVAIYFNLNTELDNVLIEEIKKYYKDVIVIDTSNTLSGEFYLLFKCMYLAKYIAEEQEKDLSGVSYNPIVKKIYKYNGQI